MQDDTRRNFLMISFLTLIFLTIHQWFAPPVKTQTETPPTVVEHALPVVEKNQSEGKKEYAMIENEALQLVFDVETASVSEINFTQKGTSHPDSLILPIEADQEVLQHAPSQALFPLQPVITAHGVQAPQKGGYTPFLRRSFDSSETQAYRIVDGKGKELKGSFKLYSITENEIVFEGTLANTPMRKTFTLHSNPKMRHLVNVRIESEKSREGMWISSGIPEVELVSGAYIPKLSYLKENLGSKAKVEKVKLPKEMQTVTESDLKWVSNNNGFFCMLLGGKQTAGMKVKKIEGPEATSRLALINPEETDQLAKKYAGYEVFIPLKTESEPMNIFSFIGPLDYSLLSGLDQILSNPLANFVPQFAKAGLSLGFLSFITEPFAKLLSILLHLFFSFTHSWGFAIILLTISLRIMMFPLNSWSMRSMQRTQAIQPEIARIQEKYKNDKHRLRQELMKVYKESKASPLAGFIPLLIQAPFLFAMYDLLRSSVELRGVSFVPGWINNLTAPDVLFSWKHSLPLIGNEFHLLPILLGAAMYLQQKVSQKLAPKRELTDQQKQMQSMGWIMTVVFTVLFYNMPSGLNIYWISSTLLGIAQQVWITKRMRKRESSLATK